MLAAYGYDYGTTATTNILDTTAGLLSLVFLVASLITITYIAARVRTRRSFQFEMFVFALVLAAAEVPRALVEMIGLDLGILATYGLEVHSASMVILAGFVAYRIFGFFRGKKLASD